MRFAITILLIYFFAVKPGVLNLQGCKRNYNVYVMNSIEQVNITSGPNKIEVIYEIKENDYICGPDEKNDVDNILNNDYFFSDSKEETEWFDDTNDNLMSQHIDYFENYNLKELHHISNYYNIPKKKLKKDEVIEVIIQFENNNDNLLIVYNRKRFWYYLQELRTDSYFSKFIVFD